MGRRADGREGARAGRGLARHARVDAVQGRRSPTTTAPRPRGCAPRARCSSGSRPSPEFGSSSTGPAVCTASPATRGTPSARPAARRAGRRPRSRSGMLPICTGSDGGGSIRIPSSYTGLFGFKVTFGRVGDGRRRSTPGSRRCPARCAARCATRRATSTRSPARPTSTRRRCRSRASYEPIARRSSAARERLRGKRVAWSSTLGFGVCDPEVEKLAHEAALALVADAGLELVDLDVQFPKPGPGVGHASSNIDVACALRRRVHGQRSTTLDAGVAAPVRGHAAPAERPACSRAVRRRDELLAAIADVFDEVDLLLTPTTATTAFAAEGPPPWRSPVSAVGGMGFGAVHRAVQHDGHARGQHPGRAVRRRHAGRPAGRRPPPRGRARARVRRARRSRTAPGPSSPPWRTPDLEPCVATDAATLTTQVRRVARYPAARDRRRSRGADTAAASRSRKPASEEVTEVAPGVLRMQLPIWMPGLGHVNMYGLVDDRGLTVVDPGLPGPQSWKALKAAARRPRATSSKDIHTVRRHALAPRPLRRRGSHRARSGRAS